MKINIKLCLWNCPRSLGSLFDLLHKLHHAFFIPLLWSLGLREISKQFRTILQQKRCAHIGIFCLVCFIRWTYFGIPQFPDQIICHLITVCGSALRNLITRFRRKSYMLFSIFCLNDFFSPFPAIKTDVGPSDFPIIRMLSAVFFISINL